MRISKELFLSTVVPTGGMVTIFLQCQIADAQQMSGAIRAHLEENHLAENKWELLALIRLVVGQISPQT